MASPLVDYYAILEVDQKATQIQIREAYKRAALKHHPDRVAANSPERAMRTRKFQEINDAYYTLSDPSRRRDYDVAREYHFGPGAAEDEAEGTHRPQATPGGFPWSAFTFGAGTRTEEQEQRFTNEQFGGAFEEMLREEGMADDQSRPTSKFWSVLGTISGATIGFIVANVPGALVGGAGGNRLGAIRDAKGKSVYAVFQELPGDEKAKVLADLAGRVFQHAVHS